MNLDEYLAALNSCPDNQLEERLGVSHGDWQLLVHGDFKAVVKTIASSGAWNLNRKLTVDNRFEGQPGKSYVFNYVPEGASLQVMDWLAISTGDEQRQSDLRNEGYNVTVWLGNYDEEASFQGSSYGRTRANVIANLIYLFRAADIPLCLPHARGTANSDMIYHPPREQEN